MKVKRIVALIVACLMMFFSVSCTQKKASTGTVSDQDVTDQTEATSADVADNIDVTPQTHGKTAYGYVVSDGEYLFYVKYSSNNYRKQMLLYDNGTLAGNGTENPENEIRELVKRDSKGNETTILKMENEYKLALANGRIYYNEMAADDSGKIMIKSCNYDGQDVKEVTTGVLRGVIDDGRYIISSGGELKSYDTTNGKTVTLSEELGHGYVTCGKDYVFYTVNYSIAYSEKYDKNNEHQSIYAVKGDGSGEKELVVVRPEDLPSINKIGIDGGFADIIAPYAHENTLYCVYEHASEEYSNSDVKLTRSSIFIKINADTDKVEKIETECIDNKEYIFIPEKVDEEYKEYYSQNCFNSHKYKTPLNKEDYSGFSSLGIENFTKSESDMLTWEFIEADGDMRYIMLAEWDFYEKDGYIFTYNFSKAALFEKNVKTGESHMIYSTN